MKRIFVLCFVIILIIQVGVRADSIMTRYYNDIQIGVNNTNLKSKLYNIDNQIYIPIRAFAEYMGIPIEWDEDAQKVNLMINNKKIHTQGNTIIRGDNIIPDESTAYKIGKIILETHCGKSLDYETDNVRYYVKAVYHPYDNSWRVYQEYEYKNGGGGGTGINSPTVALNASTGEVLYLNTEPFVE